jgi:hypothetical protein
MNSKKKYSANATRMDVDIPANLVLTLDQWAARDLPQPDYLLGEMFSTTTRMLLAADTGIGKSRFSIAMGMRMALGSTFLHWAGRRPARILYIDGEMSNRLLKLCLAQEVARLGQPPPATFFAFSREDVPGLQPLNTIAGQKTIDKLITEHCGGVDAVIFDNVMALISGNHSEEEGWSETLPWIRDLTRRAIGQVWIHHTGHEYGTKTREWEMDTYVQLDRIEGGDINFLLTFRKARERNPTNREQFADAQISLVGDQWTCQSAEGSRKTKLAPETQKFFECLQEIATTNGIGKYASIENWRRNCIVRGLIDPQAKAHSARTLFSRHKSKLISLNWIECDEANAWLRP